MSDRIVLCKCPHCKEEIEVFVMIGQTFEYECEECGQMIYFDDCGEIYTSMTADELKELEKERDDYYNAFEEE